MSVRARRALLTVGALALLALITWADYATGYELGLFVLYLAPVALVAWYGSRGAGVLTALTAGACWYLSDRLAAHPYSNPLLIYWETFMRLVSFLIAALALSQIRSDLRRREELLQVISHDLRSPLGAIVGQAQLLGKRANGDAFVTARVESIRRCAARMNTMIEDVLDGARHESRQLALALEPIEVGAWLAELVERCAPVLEAGRVRLTVAPDAGIVALADPNRLDRIVLNLLSNALKYSPPESPVEIGATAAAGRVILAVTDHGNGIPQDDLPFVFDRFYRGRGATARAGLGIGLYSVRLLVEAHGGAVRAKRSPGGGTTFEVTLRAPPVTTG